MEQSRAIVAAVYVRWAAGVDELVTSKRAFGTGPAGNAGFHFLEAFEHFFALSPGFLGTQGAEIINRVLKDVADAILKVFIRSPGVCNSVTVGEKFDPFVIVAAAAWSAIEGVFFQTPGDFQTLPWFECGKEELQFRGWKFVRDGCALPAAIGFRPIKAIVKICAAVWRCLRIAGDLIVNQIAFRILVPFGDAIFADSHRGRDGGALDACVCKGLFSEFSGKLSQFYRRQFFFEFIGVGSKSELEFLAFGIGEVPQYPQVESRADIKVAAFFSFAWLLVMVECPAVEHECVFFVLRFFVVLDIDEHAVCAFLFERKHVF
ncbi:hypothetical protein OH491_24350 [Termitidicoccus mucosus]